MGKLTIDGTLDLAQFWPEGESDADTAKVVIIVEPWRHSLSGVRPEPAADDRLRRRVRQGLRLTEACH
jgi:hypothetical protein